MTFLWPELLWLLALVPLVVGVYVLLLRRKQQAAVRYASLAIVREAMGAGSACAATCRRALFLLALTLMIVAIARPAAVVTLPSAARDRSSSRWTCRAACAPPTSSPTASTAAQAAARAFIDDQPHNVRIGIVSFAGTAAVVQPPTANREDLLAAIDRFQLQRGTAVGSGILVSLKTIFPDVEFDLRSLRIRGPRDATTARRSAIGRQGGGQGRTTTRPATSRCSPARITSAAIILLTDGQTTTGPDPIEAAKMAAERGVRVFTVGIGTPTGEIIGAEGWSMRVRLDEDALKKIAQHHARRVLLRRHRGRPEEDLPGPQLADGAGEEGDRDHGAVRRGGGGHRDARRGIVAAVVQPTVVRRR